MDQSKVEQVPTPSRDDYLDKARRAGVVGAWLTVGVLLLLLFDERRQNAELLGKLAPNCPALPAADAARDPEADEALAMVHLIQSGVIARLCSVGTPAHGDNAKENSSATSALSPERSCSKTATGN